MYIKYFKRLFDIVLSLIAIIILSPVLLITAILVRIKLGSPVIFKQKRAGKGGKIFTIYKFRTMTDARDENGALLPDEIRLTKFGNMLRKLSLDELLEILNILQGRMSIIGPRPLLAEYLPLYTEEQKHRHDVRPGLTGLAQVNGRNEMDWDMRLKYDLEYVHKITLSGDIKIFFKTVVKVVAREGISGTNSVIIEPPKIKEFAVSNDYISVNKDTTVSKPLVEAAKTSDVNDFIAV